MCRPGPAALCASMDEEEESPATEKSEREKAARGSSDYPECLVRVQFEKESV